MSIYNIESNYTNLIESRTVKIIPVGYFIQASDSPSLGFNTLTMIGLIGAGSIITNINFFPPVTDIPVNFTINALGNDPTLAGTLVIFDSNGKVIEYGTDISRIGEALPQDTFIQIKLSNYIYILSTFMLTIEYIS